MAAEVHVSDVNGTSVGSVVFTESPSDLRAERTPTGFRLLLPTTVNLEWGNDPRQQGMLSNLHCSLHSVGPGAIEIGVARDEGYYTAAKPRSSVPGNVWWRGDYAALLLFERLRDGKPPKFQVHLEAEFCRLLLHDRTSEALRTGPHPVRGTTELTYPSEVWTRMIRSLGVAEAVLVEIPVPKAPPSPWDEVWKYLSEARDAFEKGGSTGWNGCVTAVRKALQAWQNIEKEDMGPGWKRPDQKDLEARTMRQRLDNLRWHLLQCAHLAPHSSADDWHRDDAVLMLATLSALLCERRP